MAVGFAPSASYKLGASSASYAAVHRARGLRLAPSAWSWLPGWLTRGSCWMVSRNLAAGLPRWVRRWHLAGHSPEPTVATAEHRAVAQRVVLGRHLVDDDATYCASHGISGVPRFVRVTIFVVVVEAQASSSVGLAASGHGADTIGHVGLYPGRPRPGRLQAVRGFYVTSAETSAGCAPRSCPLSLLLGYMCGGLRGDCSGLARRHRGRARPSGPAQSFADVVTASCSQ